jgi:hypothetical protein
MRVPPPARRHPHCSENSCGVVTSFYGFVLGLISIMIFEVYTLKVIGLNLLPVA